MCAVCSENRVLIIVQDQERADKIQLFLRKSGIAPNIGSTVHSAVSQMVTRTFDVVALDQETENSAVLIELLLDVRHAKNTLLLLFSVDDSESRIAYLNRGFDMCLPQSEPKECSAAICALLRRPSVNEYPVPPERITRRALVLDPMRQKVLLGEREIILTTLEFRLLYFLASNPSIVFSQDVLYERIWRGGRLYRGRSVTNLVSSVRRKLNTSPRDDEYIKTVKYAGYCFVP